MTHATAVALVRGKSGKASRKIGNNTIGVIHDDGSVGIILHATEVVRIHADGRYTLNSGGWQTATTKARINQFSPARAYSNRRVWFVCGNIRFQDGMTICPGADFCSCENCFSG